MIPTRIYLQNFMNHIESDIDCSEINGAIIVAKNNNNKDESNGLGKTTIFTAITYALFGKVSTSVLEKSIRDGEEKLTVEFEFILNDKSYKIRRSRSASKSDLRFWEKIDNEWVPYSGRVSETEVKIAELIKVTYTSFMHSINFSQYSLQGLVSAKNSAEREKILKEPLNVEIFSRLEKLAKSDRSELKKEADQLTGAIQALGDPKESEKKAKQELDIYKIKLEEKNNLITKINNNILEKDKELSILKNDIPKSDETLLSEISNTEKELDQLFSRTKQYKSRISELESKKQSLKSSLTSKQDNISKLESSLSDLKCKDTNKEDLEKKLEKTKGDELNGHKLLARYESEYDQANKSIPKDDVCITCSQPITKEYREQFEQEISKLLTDKAENISKTKAKLNKCIEFNKKLANKINEIDKLKRNIISQEKELQSLKLSIEKDNQYIAEYKSNIDNYNVELSGITGKFNTLTIKLKSLKESATKTDNSELNNKIIKIQDDIKLLNNNLSSTRKEIIELKSGESVSAEAIRIAKDGIVRIKEYKDKLKGIRYDLKIYDIVVNAFSSNGITRFIIYSIINDLQHEANDILHRFRNYMDVEFDDEINIRFKVHGSYREYDSLSIGQKIYIAFALKLGYSRVIQNKLGVKIQFLLLDEVDQSLDKAGVNSYIEIIKSLQSEYKCFVITHNDTVKDKFSHAILVEGDIEKGSRARLTTEW